MQFALNASITNAVTLRGYATLIAAGMASVAVMHSELIIAGLFVGLLVGLTGVGGGSVMTPLLLWLGIDPLLAIGSDLLYNVPTKLFAWYLYRRRNSIRMDLVRPLCIGGVPSAVAGLVALQVLSQHVNRATMIADVKHAIGIAICLSAAMIIIAPLVVRRREAHRSGDRSRSHWPARRLILIGAIVGFLVSFTSIGAGAIAMPLLMLTLPDFEIAELVGSDIAFSTIILGVAVAGHWKMGHVNFAVSLSLSIGSLLGVYAGNWISSLLEQRWLRPALAIVLIAVGVRLV